MPVPAPCAAQAAPAHAKPTRPNANSNIALTAVGLSRAATTSSTAPCSPKHFNSSPGLPHFALFRREMCFLNFFFYSFASPGDLASNLSPAKSHSVTLDKVILPLQAFKLLLHLLQVINILLVPGRPKVN